MNLQHVNIKLFVSGELPIAPERLIDTFHQWIKDEMFEELLVDVADYRHVPAGPGVMLIGLEADYSLDHADGRWGLRYNRKAIVEGSNQDRFSQAFKSAARACQLLEALYANGNSLKFVNDEFELFINDRALAANTQETFSACRTDLESFLRTALGHDDFTLERQSDPRRCFGIHIKTTKPFDLSAILQS